MDRSELIGTLRHCMEMAEAVSVAEDNCNRVRKQMEELNRRPPPKKVTADGFSSRAALIGFLGTVTFGALYLLMPKMRAWMAEEAFRTLVAICVVVVMTAVVSLGAGILAGKIIQKREEWAVEEENDELLRRWKRRMISEGYNLRQDLHKFEEQRETAAQALNDSADRCGLHSRYRDKRYLQYIIAYLEAGRADDLKEALNLFEEDRERYRLKREREQFRESVEALIREELGKLREDLKRDRDTARTASIIAETAAMGLDGTEEPFDRED